MVKIMTVPESKILESYILEMKSFLLRDSLYNLVGDIV